MHTPCLKRISQTAFICMLTGVIIYEAYAGEHHAHIPEQTYPTTTTTTTTIVGTASVSTTTTL